MGCSALIGQSDMPELFDQEKSYKQSYLACNIVVHLVQNIESQCVTPSDLIISLWLLYIL